MKSFYIIALLVLIFSSCKDESYFYKDTPESVDMSMWEYLEQDSTHSYFMSLVSEYNIKENINPNNPTTLFIPTDEALQALDTTILPIKDLLEYLVVPTLINIQSMTETSKVKTLLEKFSLLEYNPTEGMYAYDGATVTESSQLFNDGRYYVLDEMVFPTLNLYEYISLYTPVFADFIDYLDYEYFDVEASTPIGFSDAGTVYDSVFSTINLFDEYYFPVGEEYRYTTATFVLFTQAQLDSALEIVMEDLDIDSVPAQWITEIVLPNSISNSIFNNSLQYSEFEEEMQNIRGDFVNVDVTNIDEDSRYICSNGIIFNLTDYVIPEELYNEPVPINGYDAVVAINEGDRWEWDLENVSVTGFEGRDLSPVLSQPELGSQNSDILELDLGADHDSTFTVTFTQKGVFGSDTYRLIWAGSNTYCGLYKIYINGVALQMRDWRGRDADYFDSFEFSNGTVRSVTNNDNYIKVGNFNQFDFEVTTISEYTDVEITIEYLGPSVDSRGDMRGSAGLIIDYLKLEIYE